MTCKVIKGENNMNQLVVQQMWLGKKKDEIDDHLYLHIPQTQEKQENMYPFVFFLWTQNNWLCQVCIAYGAGNDF